MKRQSELLQAAYDICRILLQERDLPTLLQAICDRLTAGSLNQSALLVLFDRDSGGVITAETGLGELTGPIMAELREGRFPDCGMQALAGEGFTSIVCTDCQCGIASPGAGGAPCRALTAPLRCTSSMSGFLSVRQAASPAPAANELKLFTDVAESVSLALRQLFAIEEAIHRESALQQVEERYELALNATQAGLWDWNIKTGEMYASPDHWDLLDYRSGDDEAAGRFIHPEDKDRVLAELNAHLTGKTEEYLIEYRVREKQGEWVWFQDRGRVVERDENNMPVRMTGTHQNITQQKKQEQTVAVIQRQLHEAVDRERSFLQTVIDSAGDPVVAIDLDYNLLLINQAAKWLVQERDLELAIQGQKCYKLFHGAEEPCQDMRFPCPVQAMMRGHRDAKLLHNPYHGNNINNTFELEISPLKDRDGALYGVIEVARDITDRLRIEEELRSSQSHLYRLAHHDTLTGLPNRLLFRDRLNLAVSKARRSGNSVALLFLDLDKFKTINDTLGHDVGDELLIVVAERLQGQCRQSDTVARLGGDEFVFILEDISKPEDASVVARKIMLALTQPVETKAHVLTISTSIGIALYPNDSADIEGVLKCADIALYAAKEVGRSNFQYYRDEIRQGGMRPQMQETQFRRALARNQLSLSYIPQYELQSGRVVGFESVVRWHHPEMGELPPAAFIPAADECGMLAEVSIWIVEAICQAHQFWQEQGRPGMPVTMNLATRQLLEADFLPMVERALSQDSNMPSRIIFELRERAISSASPQVARVLERLGEMGFHLSADELGSGASPLPRLQQWPFQRITLDRGLVAQIGQSEQADLLLTGIIRLGHALKLLVLADGVEKTAQEAALRYFGCDLGQGPFWSVPLTKEEALSMLASPQKDN